MHNDKLPYFFKVLDIHEPQNREDAKNILKNNSIPINDTELKIVLDKKFGKISTKNITSDLTDLDFEITPMSFVDLSKLPPRQFLIKDLSLEKGVLANICGTGYSGKTLLAMTIGLCVSTGLPLFGKFAVAAGKHKVLHIDLEQSAKLTQRRYSRLASGLGIKNFSIDRTNLNGLKFDDPNYTQQQMLEFLVKKCNGYSVVILDSFRKSIGADENSSQVAGTLTLYQQVAEQTGCVFIFISHMGKSTSGSKQTARGSSAIYDGVDVQIDLNIDAYKQVTLSCAKNRDGVEFDKVMYSLKDGGEFIYEQNCSEQLKLILDSESTNKAKLSETDLLLNYIRDSGFQEVNQKQILEFMKDHGKGGKDSTNNLLKDMIDADLLDERRGDKNARLFKLSDNGHAHLNYEIKNDLYLDDDTNGFSEESGRL